MKNNQKFAEKVLSSPLNSPSSQIKLFKVLVPPSPHPLVIRRGVGRGIMAW